MYTITIKETKTVTKKDHKEWEIIGTKEIERQQGMFSGTGDAKTRIENVYGWTPEIEKEHQVSTTLLEQTVEEMDLKAVIKAINGI